MVDVLHRVTREECAAYQGDPLARDPDWTRILAARLWNALFGEEGQLVVTFLFDCTNYRGDPTYVEQSWKEVVTSLLIDTGESPESKQVGALWARLIGATMDEVPSVFLRVLLQELGTEPCAEALETRSSHLRTALREHAAGLSSGAKRPGEVLAQIRAMPKQYLLAA